MKSLGRGLAALIPKKEQAREPLVNPDRSVADDRVRVIHVSVEALYPNARQPRRDFTERELEELATSIRIHGILEPLIVTPRKEGSGYEVIAGERRLRAAKIAGLKSVPAIVRSAGELEKIELALIENIQRQDLNPMELAHSYQTLTSEFGLTIEELSRRVGKGVSTVANFIRLLRLPAHMQKAIVERKIGYTTARAILMLDTPALQEELFQKAITQHLTGYEVEQAARDALGKVKVPKSRTRYRKAPAPDLAEAAELEQYLATRVEVYRRGAAGGTIVIRFHSNPDFKRIMNLLLPAGGWRKQ